MKKIKRFLKAKTIVCAAVLVLGGATLATFTGCVGYVDGGGGGVVDVGGPDVYVFGGRGGWDRGRDVHAYSARGHASIGAAHGGFGGHGGGGHR